MVTDRGGHALDHYPDLYREARLIGITNESLAAYHDDSGVFLAELDEEDEIRVPPDGYGRGHHIDLEGFEWTLGEYIVNTAVEEGQWRALTDYGEKHMKKAGYSRIGIVQR